MVRRSSRTPPRSIKQPHVGGGYRKRLDTLELKKLKVELRLKEVELELRNATSTEGEQYQSDKMPLVDKLFSKLSTAQATVLVALIGLCGALAGAYLQRINSLDLKEVQLESDLIASAVKAGDPERSKDNLLFLVETGLVSDPTGKMRSAAQAQRFRRQSFSKRLSLTGTVSEAEMAVVAENILQAIGLPQNYMIVAATNDFETASSIGFKGGASLPIDATAAISTDGDRYIIYNPNFVAKLLKSTATDWSVYALVAHELAHHLIGHTLSFEGSRPMIELQADEWVGFVLASLGATLEEALVAMKTSGKEVASATHPAKNERLEAIKRGWRKTQVEGLEKGGENQKAD